MSLYKQAHSQIWWSRLTWNGQRLRRSTGTDDRGEAEKAELRFKLEMMEAAPTLKGHTWGKAVLQWCADETRSESEMLNLQKFKRHFHDRPLSECTTEAFQDALAFCRTPGTYNRYRGMIRAILNLAKKNEQISALPLFPARTDKPKPRDWITVEEWEKLQSELPPHQRRMATFSIETGLRQANVLNLRWRNVSMQSAVCWVERNEAKAGKPISVPLNQTALEILKLVAGDHKDFVFVLRGKPITDIKTGFMHACIRAGLGSIKEWEDRDGRHSEYTGFTWHGLRHTWASWHIQNGTPPEVLMKLGGWSDLRMVLHYAHRNPGHIAAFAGNTRPSRA